MASTGVWRSRPIFITSTFRDMHAERDYLRSHVFPALEERLRQRRTHLEPIDLRWGVETQREDETHAKELLILKVCLAEVERSRPFLIALIGDRYGWVPPEERMIAAAQEAGFDGKLAGRSVTDLEIEYGALARSDGRPRCLFYIRNSLPYAQMPSEVAAQYADHYSSKPGAQDSAARLEALKHRIETELPDRVRRYTAQWDPVNHSVTGLQAWGEQVLEDLWCEMEAEISPLPQQGEPTWQEEEAWTLEQFVEDRARNFIGREQSIEALLALARSPAAEGQPWGACVIGQAGAGKSALFAELSRRLSKENVLVLTHAAGTSPRSTQVDTMLRRWIDGLATGLGMSNPLGERATAEEVEQTFHSLLGRASTQQRVVILIDALNQFEPTPRARHLTWLPKLWPSNARLIATAIPGEATCAFGRRVGTEQVDLPPLNEREAVDIARGICRRYHRDVNPQVLDVLRDKRRADGQAALGNPLWLELAVEELNLLDADDFARAERDFTGSPGEQLHQLLLAVAEDMPVDVEGMYGWMLKRAELLFGKAWVQSFVNVIAVSRHGWRESDLRALMPTLSGQSWDDLKFAALRRTFRAHLVKRGAHAQWDFSHAQMRMAVERERLSDPVERHRLHRTIADYLDTLPRQDPLHEREMMIHLVGADDRKRAARYYGSDLTTGELTGATRVLAEQILANENRQDNIGLMWVTALLQETDDDSDRGRLCHRFNFDLHDALVNDAQLVSRRGLVLPVKETLTGLVASNPNNRGWYRGLSVSYDRVGDVLRAQGDGVGALTAYRASLAICEGLAAQDPKNVSWQRDLSVIYNRIGDVLRAQGDGVAALTAYRAALAICEWLVEQNPTNTGWQYDLLVSCSKVGDVLRAQGDGVAALTAYRSSLGICERLADQDPTNTDWQQGLSVSHDRIGNVLRAQGDGIGALTAFQASLRIRMRLAAQDPENTGWQHDLSISQGNLGDVLRERGEEIFALTCYRASLAIYEQLAARDPTNANWQQGLSVIYDRVGDVLRARGDGEGALRSFQASMAICERLVAQDPKNPDWQRSLVVSFYQLGNLLGESNVLLAGTYWFRCYQAIRGMKAAGMDLDPQLKQLLERLDKDFVSFR